MLDKKNKFTEHVRYMQEWNLSDLFWQWESKWEQKVRDREKDKDVRLCLCHSHEAG